MPEPNHFQHPLQTELKMHRTIQKEKNNKASVRYLLFLTINMLFASVAWSQGNNLIYISGRVIDKESGKPISNVSVGIKGTISGTITSDSGNFSLRTKLKFPLTLVFTS